MNYVILDMEWDSAFCKKHSRFINEILQIGAVKLNGNFEVCDTFEVTVKSSLKKKVSGRFSELTGITTEDMLSGIPLCTAVKKYNDWLGDNTVTMTWSDSDLYTILENETYLLDGVKFKMDKYLDLQKYIQNEMRLIGKESKNQISLGNAAQLLGVSTKDLDLHTAKDDSLLSAAILKKYFCKERFDLYLRDTSNPDFYKRLAFKPYYIDDLSNADIDKSELIFKCDICGETAERTSKWHYKNRNFTATFHCKHCKRRFLGRISFRKNFDNITVKKRICELKKKKAEVKNNDMQSMSEKMLG